MLSYQEFLKKQSEVYKKFDEVGMKTAFQDGLKPDPVLAERKGGYLIVLRPSWEMQKRLGTVAASLTADPCLEVVAYRSNMVHTTISDYRVAPGFDPAIDPDRENVLAALTRAAQKATSGSSWTNKVLIRGHHFQQDNRDPQGDRGPRVSSILPRRSLRRPARRASLSGCPGAVTSRSAGSARSLRPTSSDVSASTAGFQWVRPRRRFLNWRSAKVR